MKVLNKKTFFLIICVTFFELLLFFLQPIFSLELTSKDVTVIRVGIVDMEKILANYNFAKKLEEDFQNFKTAKQSSLTDIEKELDDLVRKKISLRAEIDQLQMQLEQLEKTKQQLNISTVTEVSVSTISVISNVVGENISSTTITSTTTSTTSSASSDVTITTATEISRTQNFSLPPFQTTDYTNYDENISQLKSTILAKKKDFDEITKSVEMKKEQLQNKKQFVEEEILQYKDKIEAEIYANLYNVIEKVAKQEKLNIVIEKSGILYGEPAIDITDKVLKILK
jgi:Skp family chaperone for outer membrane proteins